MNLYLRFFRHGGIFRSDVGGWDLESLGRGAASRGSAPGQATSGRDGRNTPRSSSTMSSGRLFLDRVARQHCPSPLHRQAHSKTVPGWGTINLQRTANSVLSVCLSQGDNRTNTPLNRETEAKPRLKISVIPFGNRYVFTGERQGEVTRRARIHRRGTPNDWHALTNKLLGGFRSCPSFSFALRSKSFEIF
jgi:hypothetical protein